MAPCFRSSLETTATFDEKSQEFVIDSPTLVWLVVVACVCDSFQLFVADIAEGPLASCFLCLLLTCRFARRSGGPARSV
jgi:hypothetical protein